MIFSKKNILDRLTTIEELKSQEIEIEDVLRKGKIIFDPFLKILLGSYFLSLEIGKIQIPEDPGASPVQYVDFSKPEILKEIDREFRLPSKEEVFLHTNPKDFLRIETRQFLGIPTDLIAQVTLEKEFMRYGLEIIGGAVLLEPGFVGKVVVDVKNSGNRPIAIVLGLPVFQVTFELLSSCVDIAP